MVASTAMSVLTIMLQYSDESATLCDEACWAKQTFAAAPVPSIKAAFWNASYGKIVFEHQQSRYYTAAMGVAVTTMSGCPYLTQNANARAIATAAGINVASYDLVEYWYSNSFKTQAGCSFAGMANYCAPTIGQAPIAGTGCRSFIRACVGGSPS